MAQNISLWNSVYSDVPAIVLPKQGGGTATFTDVSNTTAVASDVADGKYFYNSQGILTAGTNQGGGSGGAKVGTATKTLASASTSIQFTGLLGEPTSFVVVSSADLATGASPFKTAAVVFDGTNLHTQTITNTNNAQVSYDGTNFSKTYSNGTLTITGSTNWQANEYKLVYSYGGSAGNIGTQDVQVGSGATSITFTGLTDEPTYFSCIFKSNFGTSSGYQRVITVVYDGNDIYGLAMDSGAKVSTAWTYTYNNGSLTITSQGTNNGGYFHQPDYYQLTYMVGGEPPEIQTEPITITQNGTYTAPSGKAYTPVTVNVSGGGGGMNVQAYLGYDSRTANSYGATSVTLTVAKSGTYKISWCAWRGSSSGTMGTNLHIGSSSGTNQQTWTGTYGQCITLTNQSLTAGTTLTLYATSGSNSRTVYVGNLIIEQTA